MPLALRRMESLAASYGCSLDGISSPAGMERWWASGACRTISAMYWLIRMMPMSSRFRNCRKVSSISLMVVSFSTTRKLGWRFLLSSPMPPSRKPVTMSSSPITAISFPLPAILTDRPRSSGTAGCHPSLLFNMLSRLVIAFFPRSKCLSISWLQSPSAVILEAPKNKVSHCFHCYPIYFSRGDGTRCLDLFEC